MSELGTRKCAILLMSLGEDRAAAVMRHLPTNEVQALGVAILKLTQVSLDEQSAVLAEYRLETEQFSGLNLDPNSYIRSVLQKALGDDRASNLLEFILHHDEPHGGMDRLNNLEAGEVVELIRDEHPQIITTLLVHLERKKASEVLEKLSDRLRHDVLLRIATFSGVQPTALKELTDELTDMLSSGEGLKRGRLGGVRTVAELVNLMTSANEKTSIAHVTEHDAALAQRIVDEMFVFEDLLDLEDRNIQRLLQDIESETLIVALKGSPQEIRDKIIKNMSARAGETLLEDMDLHIPVRVSQVETEQKAILQIVRRLVDAGEIQITAPGTDAFV